MNPAPLALHIANAELSMARTYAANLHMARSEAQLVSRISMALECCAAAREAAVRGELLSLAREADQIAAAVRAAIVTDTAIAA